MAVYESPGGIILTDAASTTGDFPAYVKGMLDGSRGGKGLNQQTIPPFANLAALKAMFPEGTDEAAVPPFARVLGAGPYAYLVPQKIWVPLGFRKKLVASTPDDNRQVNAGGVISSTGTLTVGPYRWPHRITVAYRVFVSGPAGNSYDAYVNVSGTSDGFWRVIGLGSGGSSLVIENAGTAAGADPTQLTGGVSHATPGGAQLTVNSSDRRYTELTAVVESMVGGSGA